MSDFSFTLPVNDSAVFGLTLTNADGSAPNFTGWALSFSAGSVTKTSGAGQITVGSPTNTANITIQSGDFSASGQFTAIFIATSGGNQSTWYGSVTITSAATRGDLTTIEKVRNHLGINGFEADAILSQLITSSSAFVMAQLGQEVLSRTVSETRDGDGTCELLLRQYPVNAVTSVTVDGVAVPARTAVDGDGWVRDGRRLTLIGSNFTKGFQNVVVVYSAGCATTPADVEQAVLVHVALKYRDRKRSGLGSESVSGEAVTYNDAADLGYISSVLDASPLKVWSFA